MTTSPIAGACLVGALAGAALTSPSAAETLRRPMLRPPANAAPLRPAVAMPAKPGPLTTQQLQAALAASAPTVKVESLGEPLRLAPETPVVGSAYLRLDEVATFQSMPGSAGAAMDETHGIVHAAFPALAQTMYLADCTVSGSGLTLHYRIDSQFASPTIGQVQAQQGHVLIPIPPSPAATEITVTFQSTGYAPWTFFGCDIRAAG